MNVRIRRTSLALLIALGSSVGIHTITHAAPNNPAARPFPTIALEKRMRGEEAIQSLKDRLPEVAAWYGMTALEFAKLLRQDRNAWLDERARLFYIDEALLPPEQAVMAATSTALSATPVSLEQTFILHSKPGAQRTIYLNFTGATLTGTAWNSTSDTITAPPFDIDGTPESFSDSELERIQYIWQRVTEDYAPFAVNVTTEPPPADLITRSDAGDEWFGTTVLITSVSVYNCNCGGMAYVGVFNDDTDYNKPALVFYDKLGNGNEKYVAEAISHEAGHNMGLRHDGYSGGYYYPGHGSGGTGWAPIMGMGYDQPLVQWSKGEYATANNTEDDFAVMAENGLPQRADDHGDALASATLLAATPDNNVAGNGVIERPGDADAFAFYSGGGTINLSINPATRSPNLDVLAELHSVAGTVLASDNPTDALNASISLDVPAGTYYLTVQGVGKGDPLTTGYTNYGSLGEYQISGSIPGFGPGTPPVAVAAADPMSGPAPLSVLFSSAGSHDPDGEPITYRWIFSGGLADSTEANPSQIYAAAGDYTATLIVTDAMGNSSQTRVKNVSVLPPPPVALVHSIVMDASTLNSGTKATAKVKVTNVDGNAIAGANVTGTWSGVVSSNVSGTTVPKGMVKFSSPRIQDGGTFTFTVTGVSAVGYRYEESNNQETSDSISR